MSKLMIKIYEKQKKVSYIQELVGDIQYFEPDSLVTFTAYQQQYWTQMHRYFDIAINLCMLLPAYLLLTWSLALSRLRRKETGVLRALGFGKWQLFRLHLYEGVIVTVGQCSLGILLGTLLGYSMLFEIRAWLGHDIEISYPW